MKKQTLGSLFAELRLKSGMTMLQISTKSGLNESTVWHLENDWPIRWETVHAILTAGLSILQGTERYEAMHALWLKKKQEKADSKPEDTNKKTLSKHATEASRRFRNLIRDLDPAQTKKVLRAAERAASRFVA
jgi:transcriptional regulator with XRE-family HTH domain